MPAHRNPFPRFHVFFVIALANAGCGGGEGAPDQDATASASKGSASAGTNASQGSNETRPGTRPGSSTTGPTPPETSAEASDSGSAGQSSGSTGEPCEGPCPGDPQLGCELPAVPTTLGQLVADMPAGTFAELQSEWPGGDATAFLRQESHNILQFADSGTWDPVTRRIYFEGSGHYQPSRFVRYSDDDNAWSELTPAYTWGSHAYDHNTIDVDAGHVYTSAFRSNSVWRYSIAGDAWESMPDSNFNDPSPARGYAYFPPLGLVAVDGVYGELTYLGADGTWVKLRVSVRGRGVDRLLRSDRRVQPQPQRAALRRWQRLGRRQHGRAMATRSRRHDHAPG